MSDQAQKVIAAFDFDHTLIDRDSLLPFLFYTSGSLKTCFKLLKLLPAFTRYILNQSSRQAVKEAILTAFFQGLNADELRGGGALYAASQLDRFIKPEAMERLKWHRDQGHECVLVSASVDLYLIPWAERHGIKNVLSSRLETDSRGCLTGKLIGKNCWGEEKRRRFLVAFGPKDHFVLYYYGDSRGDLELLNLADYPYYRTFI